MQGVAAAWLMTTLTSSPLLIALLTTAGSLPLFLVGLPAGALADVVDRRWLVLWTQAWMLATAAVLGVLSIVGWINPWGILSLTFLLGIGGALSAPAWQAIVPELVGIEELAGAVALNSAGFNLARAIGPAIGGLLVAAAGAGSVFILNALSFIGIMIVIYRWRPVAKIHTSAVPSESVLGALSAGMRYARHSRQLWSILVRTGAFVLPASGLWALLPVIASRELHLGATGYGVLLGSLGIGAVSGAFVMPRVRAQLSTDMIITIGSAIFGVGMLGIALIQNLLLVNLLLFAMGLAWLTTTSSLNVSAQTSAPNWVVARVLGVYLLVFQGGLAGGGVLWGTVAGWWSDRIAMGSAAILLGLGLLTVLRWRVYNGEGLDLSPSQHWPLPALELSPQPGDGPVLVLVEYHVPPCNAESFILIMNQIEIMRRRDGAQRWSLYQDQAESDRYIETFEVATWAEHMRQHERTTVADKEIEEYAFSLQSPGTSPIVSHFIATSSTRGRSAASIVVA
ncbi:MAG: MFS transporter [Herpetosiphon sp.]